MSYMKSVQCHLELDLPEGDGECEVVTADGEAHLEIEDGKVQEAYFGSDNCTFIEYLPLVLTIGFIICALSITIPTFRAWRSTKKDS